MQNLVNELCDTCPKQNMVVQLKVKDQYGNKVFYPHNHAAHTFANIAGTKTITVPTLKYIMALGYTIEFVHEEVKL